MRRKAYERLLKWKEEKNGKTAILIEGARRVGKSYLAQMFAKENYKSYILIDFSKVSNDVKELFNNYLDNLDYFFMYLSEYFGIKLYERDTAIIFDEVQFFPKARGAIKHLVADGRYDYIETGSLISIKKNIKDILIPSEEEKINMIPLDFEEFLWAMGNDMIYPYIKDCYNNKKPLEDLLHRKVMDYFKQYIIVGGMPQAVLEYTTNKDFKKVDEIKRNIIKLYRDDIRKNSDEYQFKAEIIFDNIPANLQKHNIIIDDSNKEVYEFLKDASLVNICHNTTEPNIGLGQRIDNDIIKCYMMDTGLLLSMTFNEKEIIDEAIYKKILFNKLTFNEGLIYENIVAQMLVSSFNKLYFNIKDNIEIDFLISKHNITSKHNIIPIEVKSSNNYTTKSLDIFKEKYKEYLEKPIIIHNNNLKEENNMLYIPIYMTPFI